MRGLARKREGVFEWEVDTPMHSIYNLVLKLQQIKWWWEVTKMRNYLTTHHYVFVSSSLVEQFTVPISLALRKRDDWDCKFICWNSNLQKVCKKKVFASGGHWKRVNIHLHIFFQRNFLLCCNIKEIILIQ